MVHSWSTNFWEDVAGYLWRNSRRTPLLDASTAFRLAVRRTCR
jgi:hypothetical protein